MGSDICRWWVECFLTAESVSQVKFCREKMKDCGVTYDVFCANAEISKFINAYKSASSRLIKKEFPQICKSLW